MIAEIVYALCAATSIGCAVLLLRSYAECRARLLFWSGLCFVFLAISNVILFVDLVMVPDIDLSVYRSGVALIGVGMLVFGLVWETA